MTFNFKKAYEIRAKKIYGDEEVDFVVAYCDDLDLVERYLAEAALINNYDMYIDSTYVLEEK